MKKQEYIKVYLNNFYLNPQTNQWTANSSTYRPTAITGIKYYSILVPIPLELIEDTIPLNTNLIEE